MTQRKFEDKTIQEKQDKIRKMSNTRKAANENYLDRLGDNTRRYKTTTPGKSRKS
jgi:hypothetical protein